MSVNLDPYIDRIQNQKDIFRKATTMHFLMKEENMIGRDIARMLNVSPAYVSNHIRLLKLPELVRDGYYSKVVTPTHLFILSRLHNEEDMRQVYEEILAKDLSTAELEDRVREKLHSIKTEGKYASSAVHKDILRFIQDIDPEATVRIVQTRIKTRIIIERKGKVLETSRFLRALAKLRKKDTPKQKETLHII